MSKFIDTSAFDRRIAGLKINAAAAVATAVNRTAQFSRDRVVDGMRSAFRAPTSYTLRSLFISRATTQKLVARVAVKDKTSGRLSPDHWLYPEVEGGPRNLKAFERALSSMGFLPSGWAAVPARATPLDAYGNIGGGLLRSILSQLQAQVGRGSNTAGSITAKRRRTRNNARYFAIAVGEQAGGLHPGVFQRMGGKSVRAVLAFVSHQPRYSKRLDYYGIGERAARERFPVEMEIAMGAAIRASR